MELAAKKLETSVLQAEVALDTIMIDLEREFSNKAGVELKPGYFVKRIQEMQCELKELKRDSEAVIQKGEEITSQLKKELQVACNRIQNLQNKTGHKMQSNVEGSALRSHYNKNI